MHRMRQLPVGYEFVFVDLNPSRSSTTARSHQNFYFLTFDFYLFLAIIPFPSWKPEHIRLIHLFLFVFIKQIFIILCYLILDIMEHDDTFIRK